MPESWALLWSAVLLGLSLSSHGTEPLSTSPGWLLIGAAREDFGED